MFRDEPMKTIFVAVSSMFTFLFGAFDLPIQILLVLVVLDFITGIAKAYCTKTLSSDIGTKGLIKKSSIFIVLIVGVLADKLLGTNEIIRTIVAYFYIANESISILENLATLGMPIPKKLIEALAKVKELGGETAVKDITEIKKDETQSEDETKKEE
jgi:toxin secretion/phage lysis holin